jgi:DNA repair exonuclease SbcCD ATPase subunit
LPIESLQLANFKNLKHIKGEKFSQIVIIAGPNGVGKSTLLDCIWRGEHCNLTKSKIKKLWLV